MARRKADANEGLFRPKRPPAQPLADRIRPRTLDEVVGQEHLLGHGRLLSEMAAAGKLHSMILWGPPGTGKTTIALLVARQSGAVFKSLAAVTSGVADLREAVEAARRVLELEGKRTVVFIDEIHRWNRAQQDAILPHVESGLITLIGATTENPSFEVIAPLLSRTRVLVLRALGDEDIAAIARRALGDTERGLGASGLKFEDEALTELVRFGAGDARRALNTLEVAATLARVAGRTAIAPEHVREAAQQKMLLYDRAGEEHYNVISAFIKSMRGSDPDAALYWMTRMLEAGEDPMFVLRRMVIFASEDIGNADPRALSVAVDALRSFQLVGMPEGTLPLTQAVSYLAMAPKSNTVLTSYASVREAVVDAGPLPVPLHLRNAPTPMMKSMGYGSAYKYPHNYEGNYVPEQYLPDQPRGRRFYAPSQSGFERDLSERLSEIRKRQEVAEMAGKTPGASGTSPLR